MSSLISNLFLAGALIVPSGADRGAVRESQSSLAPLPDAPAPPILRAALLGLPGESDEDPTDRPTWRNHRRAGAPVPFAATASRPAPDRAGPRRPPVRFHPPGILLNYLFCTLLR